MSASVATSVRIAQRHFLGMLLPVLLLAGSVGAEPGPDAFGSVAGAVLPAVLAITIPSDVVGSDLPDERRVSAERLRELSGEILGGSPRPAVATGVILDPGGLVLTAAHAVRGVTDVEATTVEGLTHRAMVVGVDRKTDLAVLRLSGPGPFPHASLGDSASVRVGDRVVAIGAPYGPGATVTAGIISATPRPRGVAAVDDLFQTDAATFPGSAGGPLVNVRGEVVGFTTPFRSGEFGISFAVPSNPARKIFALLAREGEIARGSLDARLQGLTPGLARAFAVPEQLGLLVSDVAPRGSAARAGLRVGDILVTVDGKRLGAPYDLERVLRDSAPAQRMTLTYWRRGQIHSSTVILGREVEETLPRPFARRIPAMLRFEVRPITPEMGVVVTHVRPDRPAAEAGIRAGDVIRAINHQPVRTIGDFEHLADAVRPGDWVAILVQRGRVALYVAVVAGSG